MSEKKPERSIQQLGAFRNEMTVENEHVVDMVSRGYMRKIRIAERDATAALKREKAVILESASAFQKAVSGSGKEKYKKSIQDLSAALKKATKQSNAVTTNSIFQDTNSQRDKLTVKTTLSFVWKTGSCVHEFTRQLSKEERDLKARKEAAEKASMEFQHYLVDLKAKRAEVTELAGDARGAIAEHQLRKQEPEMVKELEQVMKDDTYQLPDAPKSS